MKNILITGGAGFISHHLIFYLIKNTNWNIVSLDRLDYSGNLNRLDNILSNFSIEEKSRVKVVFHDLKSEINPWIKKELGDINIILHLAAGSHVDRSIDYPMEFVLDNVVGTANILEYARFINDNNGLVCIVSNGSKSLSWWRENTEYLNGVSLSYHVYRINLKMQA